MVRAVGIWITMRGLDEGLHASSHQSIVVPVGGGWFARGLWCPAAIALLVAVAASGAQGAASVGVSAKGVGTKFVWAGTITTSEQVLLTARDDGAQSCVGSVQATIRQTLRVPRQVVRAVEARSRVWESRIQYQRAGAPVVGLSGQSTCTVHKSKNSVTTTVGDPHVLNGYSTFGALTVRYYSADSRLEIVPEYGGNVSIAGNWVEVLVYGDGSGGTTEKGNADLVQFFGLPRLELHPQQDPRGDYRGHVLQTVPNILKLRPAGFLAAAEGDKLGSGFDGSPITTSHGFLGRLGGQEILMHHNFKEHVTGDLSATVFGPDADMDGVNDGADPDPRKPDADGDGFPDYWELKKGTDPRNREPHPDGSCCPGAPDSDGDGHSDPQEIAGRSDPNDPADVPKADEDGPVKTKTKPGGGGGEEVVPPGCKKGLVYYECRVMLSVNATLAMADHPDMAQPFTLAQVTNWCKSILTSGASPVTIGKCVGIPALVAAQKLSLSVGLRLATSPPRCFYFRAMKHRAPSLTDLGGWSSSWSLSYKETDFLYDRGETTTFAGRTFTCKQ